MATKNILFSGDLTGILFVMIPLLPIWGLPILFQSTKIEVYEDFFIFKQGFKKKKYSLNGIKKVYRKTIREQFTGEGFQNFQYISLQFQGGFTVSFPFSFLSLSKGTPGFLNHIEKLNPEVEFDDDTILIKKGQEHPMNKWFSRIILGLGSGLYLIIIVANIS
ncbi:hypothetical protein [Mesobacillus sp.]